MSIEALVLALSAVIRPTSAAAVAAMLSARNPQRLLVAYLLAGLAFSVGLGTLVVVVLRGAGWSDPSSPGHPVVDLALGAGALVYAVGAWTGWLPRQRAMGSAGRGSGIRRRLRDLTPAGAAVAGVLTHLPGLVYLAALNAIVGAATGTVNGMLQVVVYNAIWFSLAIAALVLSVYRPGVARALLERLGSWIHRHRQALVVVLFGALGAYLVASGVVELADART